MRVCQRLRRHLWELWILKRLIVIPAIYPRFLEIAELARSLCHSWATCLIACSHRRHGQDQTVSSCPCWLCEHSCREDETVLSCLDPVSMSFVSFWPSFQFPSLQQSSVYLRLNSCKLETGLRQDNTVLYYLQLCSHRWHRQDSFVLSVSAVWASY